MKKKKETHTILVDRDSDEAQRGVRGNRLNIFFLFTCTCDLKRQIEGRGNGMKR